jgi:PIN domain nuclease of toxin-antitoxin system
VIQLDTHSLIWLSLQPEKLSADAKAAIEESVQSEEKIVISVMTLWEVAQLVMRGRIFLRVPLETFLKTIEENYEVLPLNRFIAIEAARPSRKIRWTVSSPPQLGGQTLRSSPPTEPSSPQMPAGCCGNANPRRELIAVPAPGPHFALPNWHM